MLDSILSRVGFNLHLLTRDILSAGIGRVRHVQAQNDPGRLLAGAGIAPGGYLTGELVCLFIVILKSLEHFVAKNGLKVLALLYILNVKNSSLSIILTLVHLILHHEIILI